MMIDSKEGLIGDVVAENYVHFRCNEWLEECLGETRGG